ncbi:MAG: hypothetical protein KatS3mg126_0337 [Lysobacteraceae bacterium]|nr:MAG: hypothetical protein KatS3mg126_0337 [Xanthomonadaceae bacterium]
MDRERLSRRIAEEAARLLARDEAATVDAARRKAARRLGVARPAELPTDAAIHEALRAYRALFGDPHRESAAERLREALEAMRWMSAFGPELAEPLDPASPGSGAIRILLYCDDPDAPLQRLMEAGMRWRQRRARLHGPRERVVTVDVLSVYAGMQEFEFWPLPRTLRGTPLRDAPLGDPLPRTSTGAVALALRRPA